LTRTEFKEQFADVLGLPPNELNFDTVLGSLESWDSVSYLATMVLIDERLGIALRPDVLSTAKTVNDLIALVQVKLED